MKKIALGFLNMNIHKSNIPIIVHHPIFQSTYLSVKVDGTFRLIDITENNQNLQIAKNSYACKINSAKTVSDVICVIRPPYRLLFLKSVQDYLSCSDFSRLLAESWVNCEDPNQDPNVSTNQATKMFMQCDKKVLMSEKDYSVYAALPEEFMVYRGISVGRNPDGLSWTMDRETAFWFSKRFDHDAEIGYVKQANAQKKNVLACFISCGEYELIINPKTLRDIKIIDND